MTVVEPINAFESMYSQLAGMVFPDTLNEISNYIFTSKYARFLPEKGRRETWLEAVARVEGMHLRKFDYLPEEYLDEIRWAFDLVREKRALPSMRAMQFGGVAIERNNLKQYNCATRHIDSIRAFSESFYLLMCGCGVGFGLSQRYIDRLPDLVSPEDKNGMVLNYAIDDSIEGWADSIEALLNTYFRNTAYSGRKLVFDYSRIRAEGAPIKTGGGKAPGYKGLKAAHIKIKALLDDIIERQYVERLRTIDAYDILMHTSDAVLSGGVRRSACIVLFDKDDDLMLRAKTGDWWVDNPQRGRSNNSVVLLRDETSVEEFSEIVKWTREWGEPGFVFVDNKDVCLNPCAEIAFIPVLDGVCGVQMCNLTTVNGSKVKDKEDLFESMRAASLIGTLQASYTDFKYLSHVARQLTEGEALLGVSITAMMDNPTVILSPEVQEEAAAVAVETNRVWAERLGINQAARVTCVKPEGTSTLALGSMSSGIHPSHARFMFRRVQANRLDAPLQLLKSVNPHAVERSVHGASGTDDVITFPIALGPDVMVKSDLSALEHLEIIRSTQRHYVVPGTTVANMKSIHHNVSCTVVVRDDEWDDVARFLFENRNDFTAVSLISASGDKDYQQAPMEAVSTVEDVARFVRLMDNWVPVMYDLLSEDDDNTSLVQESACAGPAGCDLK
jgi:ribonucleoside-diphosphate reductase alpha chain